MFMKRREQRSEKRKLKGGGVWQTVRVYTHPHRQTDRQTDRQTHTHTHTQTGTDTHTHTQTGRHTHTDTHTHTHLPTTAVHKERSSSKCLCRRLQSIIA